MPDTPRPEAWSMATAEPLPALSLETLDIISPEHYEQHGYPHREWAYLRKHAPVFWYERPNADPFWAITKHADIIELGKQPQVFLNAPRLAVFTNDKSQNGSMTLQPGQRLRFRYRVVIHPGDAKAADVAGLWKQYISGK